MTCQRCASLGWGDARCGWCGTTPAHRKPMTVIVSKQYPPPEGKTPLTAVQKGDTLTPAGRRNRDSKKGLTRQQIHDKAVEKRKHAESVRLIRGKARNTETVSETATESMPCKGSEALNVA